MSLSRLQKAEFSAATVIVSEESEHAGETSSAPVSEMLFTATLQLEAQRRGTDSAGHVRVPVHAWIEVGFRLTIILGSRPMFT